MTVSTASNQTEQLDLTQHWPPQCLPHQQRSPLTDPPFFAMSPSISHISGSPLMGPQILAEHHSPSIHVQRPPLVEAQYMVPPPSAITNPPVMGPQFFEEHYLSTAQVPHTYSDGAGPPRFLEHYLPTTQIQQPSVMGHQFWVTPPSSMMNRQRQQVMGPPFSMEQHLPTSTVQRPLQAGAQFLMPPPAASVLQPRSPVMEPQFFEGQYLPTAQFQIPPSMEPPTRPAVTEFSMSTPTTTTESRFE